MIRNLIPLGEFQRKLQGELSETEQIFGEVFSQNDAFFGLNSLGYPKCNMLELDDKFVIELAVAGLNKEDLSVKVEENRIVVAGEKKSKYENAKYHVKELSDRSFRRFITLPSTVDRDTIESKFENGVLEIVLPKKPETKKDSNRVVVIK
jgi:HSP20 family protein